MKKSLFSIAQYLFYEFAKKGNSLFTILEIAQELLTFVHCLQIVDKFNL